MGSSRERPPCCNESEDHGYQCVGSRTGNEGLEVGSHDVCSLYVPEIEPGVGMGSEERASRRDRFVGVAGNNDVTDICSGTWLLVREGGWCGVTLEHTTPIAAHRIESGDEIVAGRVGRGDDFEPGHLGVDVRECGVASGSKLMNDVHGPGGAALEWHGDNDVAVAPLDPLLDRVVQPRRRSRGTVFGFGCGCAHSFTSKHSTRVRTGVGPAKPGWLTGVADVTAGTVRRRAMVCSRFASRQCATRILHRSAVDASGKAVLEWPAVPQLSGQDALSS